MPNASFALTSADFTRLAGAAASDRLGRSVAAGDLNGDGIDDLAIGATGDTAAGGANSGAVYLVYGQSSSLSGGAIASNASAAKFIGTAGARTGSTVNFGDINGDGYVSDSTDTDDTSLDGDQVISIVDGEAGTIIVLHKKGKKVYLVNLYTGEISESKSDREVVKNKNIKETKTKATSKKIQLRSSKSKVLSTFTVTKKYKLKLDS